MVCFAATAHSHCCQRCLLLTGLCGVCPAGVCARYPRNCLSKTCSAYCNMGCRSGHKQSSEVWLVDAVRAGAQVLTGVQADKVLMQACQVRSLCGGVKEVP